MLYCRLPRGKDLSSCRSLFCVCWNNRPQGNRPFLKRKMYVLSALFTYHVNYHLQKKLLKLLVHLAILQSRKQYSKRRVSFWSSIAPLHHSLRQMFSMLNMSPVMRQPSIGGRFMESRLECTNKNSHLTWGKNWVNPFCWSFIYTWYYKVIQRPSINLI